MAFSTSRGTPYPTYSWRSNRYGWLEGFFKNAKAALFRWTGVSKVMVFWIFKHFSKGHSCKYLFIKQCGRRWFRYSRLNNRGFANIYKISIFFEIFEYILVTAGRLQIASLSESVIDKFSKLSNEGLFVGTYLPTKMDVRSTVFVVFDTHS